MDAHDNRARTDDDNDVEIEESQQVNNAWEEERRHNQMLYKQWTQQASLGSRDHISFLVRLLLHGSEHYPYIEKDPQLSFKWLLKLVELDDEHAVYRVGMIYSKGSEEMGIKPNSLKAMGYLRAAHQMRQPNAAFSIAHLYAHGRDDMKADLKKAAEWYQKCLDEQRSPAAMANLGEMYLYGRGVAQDFDKAFKLNSEAAESQSAPGIGNAGFCYEKGYGVAKNLLKAKEFYISGALKGSQHSAMNLALLLDRGLIEMSQKEMSRSYNIPLPYTPKGWLSYAMKDVTQGSYYKYRLAFVNDVGYQKKLAHEHDPDACIFLAYMYAYGLLHNAQNISRSLSYFKDARGQDSYALRKCNEMESLQNALTDCASDKNFNFCGEVWNIIIGYMFDLDLQFFEWESTLSDIFDEDECNE